MSDQITDAMVETAARAERNVVWGDVIDWDEADPKSREMFSRGIRPALEAAAPHIAAAALRDAADWLDDMARGHRESAQLGAGRALISRLRARANELEAGRG